MEKEDLKEIVMESVERSHNAISAILSNSVGEFKTTLAVHGEKLDRIDDHLKQLNGKAVTNMNDISGLKLSQTEFKTSLNTAQKVGGGALVIIMGLIGTITGIALYAYNGDKAVADIKTQTVAQKAATVANDLSTFQSEQTKQQAQIIELLTKLTKK